MFGFLYIMFTIIVNVVHTLDNGLALTPPMGWLAWERFRCEVDCNVDPDNCVDEKLFMQHADILAQPEWRKAGYEYINIDDCWANWERDSNQRLVGNSTRFPSGMKQLAEYIHSKGLKFGIYNDMGTETCGAYPGECKDEQCTLPGYMGIDAATYAAWGVDSLKMDGCNSNHSSEVLDTAYIFMGDELNNTGRDILYSCSWPDYIRLNGLTVNYTKIASHCHLWRMYGDIQDSWDSVVNIIDWIGQQGPKDGFLEVAGPGRWNDPDMLIIGNFALSYEQSKTQMALWSIMAAPLLMGNDLRNLDPKMKEILLAEEVIAVNQDVLGKQGYLVSKVNESFCNKYDIWMRHLHGGDIAVAFWARSTCGLHMQITVNWQQIELSETQPMKVRDLFEQKDLGSFMGSFTSFVNLHGTMLLRFSKA